MPGIKRSTEKNSKCICQRKKEDGFPLLEFAHKEGVCRKAGFSVKLDVERI